MTIDEEVLELLPCPEHGPVTGEACPYCKQRPAVAERLRQRDKAAEIERAAYLKSQERIAAYEKRIMELEEEDVARCRRCEELKGENERLAEMLEELTAHTEYERPCTIAEKARAMLNARAALAGRKS